MVSSYKQPSHIGVLKRSTTHYDLEVPYFDTPGWGAYIEDDLDTIDALLFSTMGLSNVKGIWANGTAYVVGDKLIDNVSGYVYQCVVSHTSAATGTFAQDRVAHPTYWFLINTSWAFRGAWAPATAYTIGDVVYDETEHIVAVASVNHTSTSNIRTDAANWDFIVDLGPTVDEAELAASQAAASASAAHTSEVNASGSASTASTAATSASGSASAASGSAASALTSANNASASATTASTAATNAQASATAAAASATQADLALDQFTDIYLGPKSADPTTDNDGNVLQDGTLYWNTTSKVFRVYDVGAGTFYDAPSSTSSYFNTDVSIDKANPTFNIDTTAQGQYALLSYLRIHSPRWNMGMDAAAESGANAGSNFTWDAYGDSGTFLGSALRMVRATLRSIFAGDLWVSKVNPVIQIDKAASGQDSVLAGSMNGKLRWGLTLGGSNPETGGNAGSNFNFDRYDDNGVYLATALNIDRQSGNLLTQGNLTLDKANPDLVFNKKASGQFARIGSLVNGTDRWWLHLGNPDAEVDPADGSNFVLYAYRNNGSNIGEALRITRSNMLAAFGGDVTVAGLLSEQGHRVVRKDGDTMTGDLTISKANAQLNLDAVGATSAQIVASSSGFKRFAISPAAGANGDLWLTRYDDAGVALDVPFQIRRSDGGTVLAGKLILTNANAGQIQFPATQNPSSDANTLDDYEEGSWTPVLRFGGVSTGITYGTLVAQYCRIGGSMSVSCDLTLTNKGAAAGNADISLPFTATRITNAAPVGYYSGMTGLTGGIKGYTAGAVVNLVQDAATAVAPITNTSFTNTSRVIFSCNYFVY